MATAFNSSPSVADRASSSVGLPPPLCWIRPRRLRSSPEGGSYEDGLSSSWVAAPRSLHLRVCPPPPSSMKSALEIRTRDGREPRGYISPSAVCPSASWREARWRCRQWRHEQPLQRWSSCSCCQEDDRACAWEEGRPGQLRSQDQVVGESGACEDRLVERNGGRRQLTWLGLACSVVDLVEVVVDLGLLAGGPFLRGRRHGR